MRFLILALVLVLFIVPSVAYAGTPWDVVIVTAQPGGNITCPADLAINVVSAYEIELAWTPATGNYTTGSVIKAAYGRYPTEPDDGFVVFEGDGNETTHWVNTEFIDVDVYYAIWATYGNDTYSECYVSGSITGGEGLAVIGANLGLLVVLAEYLAVPLLFAVLSIWKRNIVCMVITIVTAIVVTPPLIENIGIWLLAPMLILIIGVGGMLVRDAWERELIW